jgi:uncharacterized protein (TIGR02145 family)
MKTKNVIWFYPLIVMSLVFILTNSCSKDDGNNNPSGSITDKDGNVYTSVTIGTQVWMVENLKTTKYNNGDLIGTTTPSTLDISAEAAPKYQWAYEGNESNVNTYGRLYTWYAVTDTRNVCPVGWHVPSDTEWTTLTDYLTNNGYGYGGSGDGIAKSMAAKSEWTANTAAGSVGNDQANNNSSGFSALPGGLRNFNGTYSYIGNNGFWWSSTEFSSTYAYCRTLNYDNIYVNSYNFYEHSGFSVRCLRDL